MPLFPHALLRTQLKRQDLLLTCSAGNLLHASTCLSHQRLIARFNLLHSLSPQQLIPYYCLLHSHSAGVNLYICASSPAQLDNFISLLLLSAGDALQLANTLSMANFASMQLSRYALMLTQSTTCEFSTASLSTVQFLYLNVLLNRLAGDILSRNTNFPDAFLLSRPSVSLICSVGDYPSRPHYAHRLSIFQPMSFSSILCATFESDLCTPSMTFLRFQSELPFASLILRGFTVLFLQTVVRLSQDSIHFSHATILLSANISTTTDYSFEACVYAPRCVNQRDYLSPSGDNLAAILFKCSCLSTFVGHSFQFGIHSLFGRYLCRRIFILLVSLAMISPCDLLYQDFQKSSSCGPVPCLDL